MAGQFGNTPMVGLLEIPSLQWSVEVSFSFPWSKKCWDIITLCQRCCARVFARPLAKTAHGPTIADLS